MSATIGTDLAHDASTPAIPVGAGHPTISAPARSAWTCSTVTTSLVTVLVIDCTDRRVAADRHLADMDGRQARRWMSRYGRTLTVNLADIGWPACNRGL
jgi:hypothetical protein